MNTGRVDRRAAAPEIVARVIFGVTLMSLGLTLLAVNFGWLSPRGTFFRAWPLALVCLGIALVAQRRYPQTLSGVTLLLAGLWAIAGQQQWIHASFWAASGPMLITVLGGSMMWQAIRRRARGAA